MDDKILQQLKSILLEEESQKRSVLERELIALKSQISSEQITLRLEPIVNQKVDE